MKKKRIHAPTAPVPLKPAGPDLWLRILEISRQPAAVFFLGCFVLASVFIATAYPLEDPDIWWHLKTGKHICDTGTVPKTDIFSYVIHGHTWITFEWLSQAVFYKIWSAFGALGIFAYREIMTALLFGVLFAIGAPAAVPAGAILLFGLSFASTGIMERPQLFTYFFALTCRVLLTHYDRRRLPTAAAIVVIHLLWANLHGGASVLGPLILAAYAAGHFIDGDRKTAREMVLIMMASVAVSLINPNTYKIYVILAATWFNPAQRWVLEWQPLSPSAPQFYLFAAYLALLTAASFALPKPRRYTALILAGLFGFFFGFRSVRNVPVAFFITCPDLLAAAVALCRGRKRLCGMLTIPLLLWLVFGHSPLVRLVRPEPASPDPITKEWLAGTCDFIVRHNMRGRMYNDYVIGGYMIWRLAPERQIFIDGRNLEYGAELMHRIARISMKDGFEDLDREYKYDYLVFQQRKDSRLLYLDQDPAWRCLYFDDGGLIYAHKGRAESKLADRLGFRYLRPNEPDFNYLGAYAADPRVSGEVLKELDRAISQAPARLTANAHLMKSYFLLVREGELPWAKWVSGVGDRFDYPQWKTQVAEARKILSR